MIDWAIGWWLWWLPEPDYWQMWMEQTQWKGMPPIPGC